MRLTANKFKTGSGGLATNRRRRGVIVVLTAVVLVVVFAFCALGIDTARLTLTQTQMQNGADAAAMAASQEITAAVQVAGEEGQNAGDANSIAIAAARAKAVEVAAANGIYLDPDRDVQFGKRTYDAETDSWPIQWGVQPFNVVRVTAHRDQPDTDAPDGEFPLAFGWAVGRSSVPIATSATAFVEARDIVVVLDFSRSMNDDSELGAVGNLNQLDIEDSMYEIYDALGPPDLGDMAFEPQYLTVHGPAPQSPDDPQVSVTFQDTSAFVISSMDLSSVTIGFEDGGTETFENLSGTSGTFSGTGGNAGEGIETVWVTSGSSAPEYEPVTFAGAPPSHPSQPQIYVTFNGTSIDVQSSKDLSNVVLEFSDGVHYKFDGLSGHSGTFAGIGGNSGKFITKAWIKSGSNGSGDGPGYGERFENSQTEQSGGAPVEQRFDDTNQNVRMAFGLNGVPYPYQSGSWNNYINYCRNNNALNNAGYRKMYGGLTFVNYLLEKKAGHDQTEDLWKTPHYPFHAQKNGLSLFCQFLKDLDFGDEIGVVSYVDYARVEDNLDYDGYNIDISNDPITSDYDTIDVIQRHRQAGQYGTYTGMGDGVYKARQLLADHGRDGARPTILVITDGNANRSPNGWSLPEDWNWVDWTDYDGDGDADYWTYDRHKQYAFWEATQGVNAGYTVHTMSVGASADRNLMEAIAFAGSGTWIDVPGGSTIDDMHEQMLAAFSQIAAKVPPPKLVFENGAPE